MDKKVSRKQDFSYVFSYLICSAFLRSRRRRAMKRMDPFTLFLLVLVLATNLQYSLSISTRTTALTFTSGSAIVFPLTGNVYPLGYYSASISIGSPPKSFDLDIDTGSDLTWVQCDAPCKGCTKPPYQQYKPQTGSIVPCSEPICRTVPGAYPCEKSTDQCDYEVQYADQGSSLGLLLRDKFQVKLKNGTTFNPNLALGCGYDQQNPGPHPPPPTVGILGLGRGTGSIVSQLRILGITQNLIGHCLSRQGGGFLALGGYPLPASGITWTPMTTTSRSSTHYSSGAAAEILFAGSPTTMKGLQFLFDSGSSYTYFNAQVYQTTFNLVKRNLVGKALKEAPEDTTLPVCWKAAKPIKSIAEVQAFFQTLTVKFSNARNVLLQLAPQDYLIVSRNGNACFGILDGGQHHELGNLNIIGDIFMQDRMVIYDNEKQQIGWFPADCTATVKP